MATSVLKYGNVLERKKWILEGLIQKSSQSFWNGLVGNTHESVIYQKNDFTATSGQNIIFDYSGNYASEGFRGKEQAFGKGKSKLKFSDSLTLEYGRYTVDNGMEFDAATIGDMSLASHDNSKNLLADYYVRAKDQMFFDCAQGFLRGKGPTHKYTCDSSLTWDDLVKLEGAAKTGIGFGTRRAPLKPFRTSNGMPVWILVLDAFQIMDLLQDPKFQAIYQNAQVRGNNNELITHAVAKIGNLLIMEAGTFAGSSSSNQLFKQAVEIQGLRYMDDSGHFSGTNDNLSGTMYSRGLLLGAGAFQLGMGTMPDYKFQPSQDFEIVSESALILTMNVDKCVLTAEVQDYDEAKVANMDYGIVAVDSVNTYV